MGPITSNPFTVLTLIAAPAVLTNASSVLALGTSNRFARAVDRVRALAAVLEQRRKEDKPLDQIRMNQLNRTETRTILLLHALTAFYLAVGSFAASALISLLGSSLGMVTTGIFFGICVFLGLAAGFVGVGSLVVGCTLLLRETRIAVVNMSEEAKYLRLHYQEYVSAEGKAIEPI